MPAGAQKRAKQPAWVKKLRSDIRQDNGAGFLVKLPSGRSQVQLTTIFDDGTRQQNYLPAHLTWAAEDALTIREWVRDIRKILSEDASKSLKQAIMIITATVSSMSMYGWIRKMRKSWCRKSSRL